MEKRQYDTRNINGERIVAFILCEARSGSTWLSYVLGSHNNVVHLGEYYRPFSVPNHVACRLCEAVGKKECDFLYGIDTNEKLNAYDFAFERFKKKILIDSSKQLDWLMNFVGASTFQIKIIHLLRDPRAWFASVKRRNLHLTALDAMDRWVNTNNSISSKIDELSLPYFVSFYDELCIEPESYFSGLCKFLGIRFEKAALNYWRFEHHGLGANGAAFNNLINYSHARVVTGDDEYYKKMHRKQFHDSRWLEELSAGERNTIETLNSVKDYLFRNGKSFSHFDRLLGDI